MSKRQWIVLALLGIADLVVLTCLAGAIVFTPRIRTLLGRATPVAEASPAPSATSTLPPTWTPTLVPSPRPTSTPFPTSTPAPTRTPPPTVAVTLTPSPTPEPIVLENADFEDVAFDFVPGWEVAAVVNWEPGEEFHADTSYARPEFRYADDPSRVIRGPTLQIQTFQWVKFKVTIYQMVEVPPGSTIQFQILAGGYSSGAGIQVRVGLDPRGGAACEQGVWGDPLVIDQESGVVTLRSPQATVGPEGQVSVCFFAEPQYALTHNAAYFDEAVLTVQPPD
jgi:hypothetical protein